MNLITPIGEPREEYIYFTGKTYPALISKGDLGINRTSRKKLDTRDYQEDKMEEGERKVEQW